MKTFKNSTKLGVRVRERVSQHWQTSAITFEKRHHAIPNRGPDPRSTSTPWLHWQISNSMVRHLETPFNRTMKVNKHIESNGLVETNMLSLSAESFDIVFWQRSTKYYTDTYRIQMRGVWRPYGKSQIWYKYNICIYMYVCVRELEGFYY